MSIVLENLRRDARMRLESDREMSAGWVIVPIIPYIIGLIVVLVLLAAIFSGFVPSTTGTPTVSPFTFAAFTIGTVIVVVILSLLVGILFAFLIYNLVKRRNTHFHRQQFLYEDLTNMLKELAGKKNIDVSISLNNMDRTMREARFEETEKSAALWAIMTVVFYALFPIVGVILAFYIFYFLMRDFFRHERREDAFFEDLNRSLATAGVGLSLPRRTIPIPDRSFILYLVLSIITLGIFAIYWVYVLVTDPNGHFRQQAVVEDTIISQVSPILV